VSEQLYVATTPEDYQVFAALVSEYVQWCRGRYQQQRWFVEQVFGHQALEDELKALAQTYGAPNGITLLARSDGEVRGGGAYRRLADGSCEMKRLFVPPRHAGQGTGRRLCAALMDAARAEGIALMRLDTARLLREAIGLYKSMGFRECPPYRHYPAELMPFLLFMEAPLSPG